MTSVTSQNNTGSSLVSCHTSTFRTEQTRSVADSFLCVCCRLCESKVSGFGTSRCRCVKANIRGISAYVFRFISFSRTITFFYFVIQILIVLKFFDLGFELNLNQIQKSFYSLEAWRTSRPPSFLRKNSKVLIRLTSMPKPHYL